MEEFLPIEMNFLAELDQLPEKYIEYLLPPLDDGLKIPCIEEAIGDIEIQIFSSFVYVKIGDHTEARISNATDAIDYINKILRDQLVFSFYDGGVEYFDFDEFENLSESSWNDYVWSGPFRYAFLEKNKDGMK
jgi:hypothetical protein